MALFMCAALGACRNDGDGEDNSENHSDTGNPTETSGEGTSGSEGTSDSEETTTEEETEDLTPKLTGENAKTIEYAERIAGGINTGYSGATRSQYAITNRNAVFNYNLTAKDRKYVSSLENTKGGVYLENTMDVFVKTNDGKVLYASDTLSSARVNIYRLGHYYYDVHILDQDFSSVSEISDNAKEISISRATVNQMSRPVQNDDGSITTTVESTADPYIVFPTARFSTEDYNAVEITLRCESASSAQLYVAAGGNSFNADQLIGFSVTPGGEYITYVIPLSQIPNYTGNVTGLRIDIGGSVDEVIEIKSMRALNVDFSGVAVTLDRNIHAYSDKMNQVLHFVTTDQVDNMTSYGMVTKISADKVDKLIVKDAGGEHTSIDGVDFDSAEYVGFDIKDVGVFGYILLADESSGKLTVTLEDGYYVITQEYTVPTGTVYEKDANIYMGHRLYTDRNHTFDEFLNEAYCERNPLEEVTITSESDGSAVLGYNVFRGAYGFRVNGTDFNQAYYNNPDKHYQVHASIKGDDRERKIYVYSYTIAGALECAALLDGDGLMLPVKLEVCKNFQGENEEPLYDKGDASYGETIFPMVIEAGSENEFTIVNMYQNWGKYPLKQLSSIQFIAPYYHLSTGVTETNCIAPYYVYGKDLWTLPDFRSMSAPLWAGQPQHTSAGRLYFLQYTTSDGKKYATESASNIIDTAGPTYSDISMDYISDDGNIKVTYRHVEMPQTDENRTYYEIRLEVLGDIEISDFKDNFSLFSFDGRAVVYDKLGYLNENNECVVVDANKSSTANYITLGKEAPYFDYYLSSAADYVNFALIIKNSDIVVGGEKFDGNFVVKDVFAGGLNYGSLTLDIDNITLKKGDYISIDMILMPWGSQNSADDSNVRNVREDSCLDPYSIAAQTGTVIEDAFVPKVKSEGNVAEFTLSGGVNNAAVRVYGFDKNAVPEIYEKVGGEWVKYEVASANGYDGYTVHYDGDGTFSYSFIINMDNADERTFRVEIK